ncbi:MAG TPA: 8-oxo-dGTP diphosphatase MutT [Gemmatimonadota bacterium]|nr:8-oxo-dGTP diphosphatase MutT [Gemmatimonadota bacterium]
MSGGADPAPDGDGPRASGGADPGRGVPADREPAALAAALLAWFDARSRDVPWRDEADPYRIWVAEVMAQQTRIDTVRAYWAPFLERFPDVEALAGAELDEVLKAWEGLGYYARARRLHRAAREVVADYGGELPGEPERLRELPGIGPYTAGAIASLAFGRAEPAIDGNVRRVLCRLFDLPDPGRAELEERARALLRAGGARGGPARGRPGDLNQALMDLGSGVCTPRGPDCAVCPVRDACRALERGTVGIRPEPRSRGPVPHHDVATAVVWREGRVLITRRPPEGLLGGLWEFPGGKVEEGETPRQAARRELWEELGIEIETGEALGRVEHAYSHFRITLHAFHARLVSGEPQPREADALAWAAPEALGDYAFPAANLRLIERLRAGGRTPPMPSG